MERIGAAERAARARSKVMRRPPARHVGRNRPEAGGERRLLGSHPGEDARASGGSLHYHFRPPNKPGRDGSGGSVPQVGGGVVGRFGAGGLGGRIWSTTDSGDAFPPTAFSTASWIDFGILIGTSLRCRACDPGARHYGGRLKTATRIRLSRCRFQFDTPVKGIVTPIISGSAAGRRSRYRRASSQPRAGRP